MDLLVLPLSSKGAKSDLAFVIMNAKTEVIKWHVKENRGRDPGQRRVLRASLSVMVKHLLIYFF